MRVWQLSKTKLRSRRLDSCKNSMVKWNNSTVTLKRCSISGKKRSLRNAISLLTKRLLKLQKWWRNSLLCGANFKSVSRKCTVVVKTSTDLSLPWLSMIKWKMNLRRVHQAGAFSRSSKKSLKYLARKNGWLSVRRDTLPSKISTSNKVQNSKHSLRTSLFASCLNVLRISPRPGP